MTQDEIIEMAEQADVIFAKELPLVFIRFAKLVAEKATEEANARANTSWTLMCKKMVAFEREACAKMADKYANGLERNYSEIIADAIRARGEQA